MFYSCVRRNGLREKCVQTRCMSLAPPWRFLKNPAAIVCITLVSPFVPQVLRSYELFPVRARGKCQHPHLEF